MKGRGTLLLCLASGFSLILASCGIPEYAYLAPPVLESIQQSPPVFRFSHDASNNDTEMFLGYEIYYKFYNPMLDYAQLNVLLGGDYAAISAASPSSMDSVLVSRGYHRMDGIAGGQIEIGQKPVLRIDPADKDTAFVVTLGVPDIGGIPDVNGGLVAQWAGTPGGEVTLLRNQALLGSDGDETFAKADIDLSPRDADVPDGLESYIGVTLPMGIAVVSYGINLETFTQVYSTEIMIQDAAQLLEVAIDN